MKTKIKKLEFKLVWLTDKSGYWFEAAPMKSLLKDLVYVIEVAYAAGAKEIITKKTPVDYYIPAILRPGEAEDNRFLVSKSKAKRIKRLEDAMDICQAHWDKVVNTLLVR